MSDLSPFEGAFSTLKELAGGGAKTEELRKDVFNDTIGDTEIDTCMAFDTNKWETGVAQHSKSWIIVEQYEDKVKAQKGHKRWLKALTKNPDMELKDINLWNL